LIELEFKRLSPISPCSAYVIIALLFRVLGFCMGIKKNIGWEKTGRATQSVWRAVIENIEAKNYSK
jgi:hypothetical protein